MAHLSKSQWFRKYFYKDYKTENSQKTLANSRCCILRFNKITELKNTFL